MNKDREFILSLAGFIKWSFDNNREANWILSNLSHDIFYQVRDEKDRVGFSSRTKKLCKIFERVTT